MTFEQALILALTIAVIILILFLVILICKVFSLIGSFQKKIEDLNDEPKNLVKNINDISSDLNCKLKFFDPFFRAMSNVGEGMEYKSASFKDKFFWESFKEKLELPDDGKNDKFSDIVNLAASGIHLWKKFKK